MSMIWTRFTSTERALLALLALILCSIFLIPWQNLWRDKSGSLRTDQNRGGLSRLGGVVTGKTPRPLGKLKTDWRAETVYSPRNGILEIELSHIDSIPTQGLDLHADFNASNPQIRPRGTWMEEQANGKFRANGLKLGAGNWTMSLTGYKQSAFAFRLEQPLSVTSQSAALFGSYTALP